MLLRVAAVRRQKRHELLAPPPAPSSHAVSPTTPTYTAVSPKRHESYCASELRSLISSLGLSEYASSLDEQQVDCSSLPLLTDSELAEIGLPEHARDKLRPVIAALPPEWRLGDSKATNTSIQYHLPLPYGGAF